MTVRLTSSGHLTKMLTVFEELLLKESMVDVTIATNDGTFISVHRIILAAASPFFKEVLCHLESSSKQHAVIYLKDVGVKEMNWILDYIYKGQVEVPQEAFHNLIKVAKQLKINGLEVKQTIKKKKKKKVQHVQMESDEETTSDTVEEIVPPLPQNPPEERPEEYSCCKCGKRYRSTKSLWRHKKFACGDEKHSFTCPICNKIFSRSDNLRRHSLISHSI